MKNSENREKLESIRDYLTVNAAASFLGVSRSTLRNWDRSGKLRAYRHPLNGYRLYLKRTLEEFLSMIQETENGKSL
ncbi:MAG TPA: helix-turn-helix domain-containing protein [bacterium]|nr:helix-turn-helix domain-containing protein [bacterium]HPO09440.1 helix-turn-helix domain-containing protein [bacterium]HQO33155.1 helix-turn-helix domain-containing protein [bacterium]HQP98497.1 helix-turn-helix domain-containing protein [bacterium]